jgi:hypothetical protein
MKMNDSRHGRALSYALETLKKNYNINGEKAHGFIRGMKAVLF